MAGYVGRLEDLKAVYDATVAEVAIPRPPALSADEAADAAAMVTYLNGKHVASPVTVQIKFTNAATHPLLPGFLLADLDADPAVNANNARVLSAAGWEGRDLGALRVAFQVAGTIWPLEVGEIIENMDGGDNSPMLLSLSTMMAIHALNIRKWSGNLPWLGGVIAVAAGLGLYNKGGDAYTAEYVKCDHPPPVADLMAVSAYWLGPKKVLWMTFFLNYVALIGFLRLSYTHLVDSANPQRMARQHRLTLAIYKQLFDSDLQLTVEETSVAHHAAVHGFSMGGAVGFLRHWWETPQCSPYLKARRNTVGDSWKGVSVCLSGYMALMGHPILTALAAMLSARVVALQTHLNDYANTPWRTSSLSRALCGEPTASLTPDDMVTMSLLSAIVLGAIEANYLDPSMASAFFVIHTKVKIAGAVTFWTQYLTSIETTAASVDPGTLMGIVTAQIRNASETMNKDLVVG